MLMWLNRARLLVRLSALFAALLIASQIVTPASVIPSSATPAFAAPASDDGSNDVSHVVNDEATDEVSEEAADEASDSVSDEPTDSGTDGAGDTTSDAVSDSATDEMGDSASGEVGDAVGDPGSNGAADDPSDAAIEAAPDEASEPVSDGANGAIGDQASSSVTAEASDPVTDAFLNRLLGEINHRRDRLGTQHLTYIPARANAALDGFLAETAPSLAWPGPCMHHLVGGAFSWDFVLAAGFGGEARGEVLACPGPEQSYWTPDRAAEEWWESPIHFGVLYADPDANALACSAYGVSGGTIKGKNGKRAQTAEAASAVLCVTFRD